MIKPKLLANVDKITFVHKLAEIERQKDGTYTVQGLSKSWNYESLHLALLRVRSIENDHVNEMRKAIGLGYILQA